MEQIIKYQDIKILDDINKQFACIPINVSMCGNQPKFQIANYTEFKALIQDLTKQYTDDIEITKNNVYIYEKEAASINKLIKQLKEDKKKYIKQFTDRVDKQVKELTEILEEKYTVIHDKTKTFRYNAKVENNTDVIDVSTTESNTMTLTVRLDKEKLVLLEQFCKVHNIEILKGE